MIKVSNAVHDFCRSNTCNVIEVTFQDIFHLDLSHLISITIFSPLFQSLLVLHCLMLLQLLFDHNYKLALYKTLTLAE